MKYEIELCMPRMPNFLTAKAKGSASIEDGINGKEQSFSVDVGELTDDQVNELISEWSAAFRAHVAKRGSAQ